MSEVVVLTGWQQVVGVMFKRPGKNKGRLFRFPFNKVVKGVYVHSFFVFGKLKLRFFKSGVLVEEGMLKPFDVYACLVECDVLEEEFV